MKSNGVTIQMKAAEQYSPDVVLFICCTRWFYLKLWMKSYGVTIKMTFTEQYLHVVLFIMLIVYNVVLTFESVNEILWCNHSIESY